MALPAMFAVLLVFVNLMSKFASLFVNSQNIACGGGRLENIIRHVSSTERDTRHIDRRPLPEQNFVGINQVAITTLQERSCLRPGP